MKRPSTIVTAALLATVSTASFAGTALAARAHLEGYGMSGSASDPAPRWVEHLGCTINGTYLGEPYCFGGNQQGWIRVGESRIGGNRMETSTY